MFSTGLFNSPGIQSWMQQIMQNPQMMNNMLQAPYMQSAMQSLVANRELAQQVISFLLICVAKQIQKGKEKIFWNI